MFVTIRFSILMLSWVVLSIIGFIAGVVAEYKANANINKSFYILDDTTPAVQQERESDASSQEDDIPQISVAASAHIIPASVCQLDTMEEALYNIEKREQQIEMEREREWAMVQAKITKAMKDGLDKCMIYTREILHIQNEFEDVMKFYGYTVAVSLGDSYWYVSWQQQLDGEKEGSTC